MRFYFRENVHGWIMTGFIGKNATWFLGFSKRPMSKSGQKKEAAQ